jgi:hypothetical protein
MKSCEPAAWDRRQGLAETVWDSFAFFPFADYRLVSRDRRRLLGRSLEAYVAYILRYHMRRMETFTIVGAAQSRPKINQHGLVPAFRLSALRPLQASY